MLIIIFSLSIPRFFIEIVALSKVQRYGHSQLDIKIHKIHNLTPLVILINNYMCTITVMMRTNKTD